jgi:hypothetical protein
MNLLTNIQDFHHGTELLNFYCKQKSLTEGDQFLTLKPTRQIPLNSLVTLLDGLLSSYPLKCVGVIEAEKSIFQRSIQKYQDQFIPPSFFHCHLISRNSPDLIHFKQSWVEHNDNNPLSFSRKEVYNLSGLVSYISKQVNLNPVIKVFEN